MGPVHSPDPLNCNGPVHSPDSLNCVHHVARNTTSICKFNGAQGILHVTLHRRNRHTTFVRQERRERQTRTTGTSLKRYRSVTRGGLCEEGSGRGIPAAADRGVLSGGVWEVARRKLPNRHRVCATYLSFCTVFLARRKRGCIDGTLYLRKRGARFGAVSEPASKTVQKLEKLPLLPPRFGSFARALNRRANDVLHARRQAPQRLRCQSESLPCYVPHTRVD